ncbi:RNA polymerase factor sigma-54 [bacterium]|nr:RNA polymerase factor sigma-54 [bacterium]MBU1985048.1 RNA polymerase factor sigma-54 [bacterium]
MHQLRQELRQRLEQYLQPQQILRSELIQLPLLGLEQRVRAELLENPFLEELPEDEAIVDREQVEVETEPAAATYEQNEEAHAALPEKHEEPAPKEKSSDEVDWENFLDDEEYHVFKSARYVPDELADAPRPFIPTLAEHLEDQLRLQRLTPEEFFIGQYIIGSINKDGHLNYPIEEIARELNVEVPLAEKILSVVQHLDPTGIAARSLQECLLLQLRQHEYPEKVLLAVRMLSECYDDFLNKRFEVIARKLDVALEDVKQAFTDVKKLNPKPGEGYFDEKQNYIVPDVVVTRVGEDGDFVVYLNDSNIPSFHINAAYKDMFLSANSDKKVKEFVTRKLESARWFINAIHQRQTTILRTMRAIVKRQEGFFRHGKDHLKPMILQDIAEDISMDISTISRVTSAKYVQTEWGVFELKYFFSERMETTQGEEISTKVIKSRLQEIIDLEDKSDPYSDQAIAEMLAVEGYPIARRTVQKYREQLSIPVKRLRREI